MYSNENIFLITGATSGIGKGVALELNKLGAKVIAVGRNRDKLEKLKLISSFPDNMILEEKNLSDYIGLDKWVLSLSKTHGKLEGLVLSAGIQQTIPIASPMSIEKGKDLFDINYFSSMQITKGFCDRRSNIGKGSSVVFISSIASFRGNSGLVSYSASKGALNSAIKSLAIEVSRFNIRVNAVLPGFVMTEMIESWKDAHSKQYIEDIDNKYPLGIGNVEDVVNPILFLLSEKSKWITGTELVVDGGGSL